MGYIAPVNHYQYKDYQQRTVKTEPSPYSLEGVFKATLDSKLEEHHQPREQDRIDYLEARKKTLYTPNNIHIARSMDLSHEKIYAKLTGKGTNFSETV
ncbi:hypothetical protein [Halobacillus salinus]|uniref:Uncharacterized protein n=1 Tax=Halobacillus salinus TaxID=192814 RepID=A0A4Z0H8F4_9BACI|nr:hypothetical protein [Halobacillus salinus]TGB05196.1 hypothetical protein E4663_09465 [Halobacillus salinus]